MNKTKYLILPIILLLAISCSFIQPVREPASNPSAAPATKQRPLLLNILAYAQDMKGVQQTLDQLILATYGNHPELLDTIVDPDNKPFKRLVRNRFEYYRAAWQADESPMSLKVRSLEARPNGYIQAMITINQWAEASWTFKKVAGRWLLAEPTVEEIGEVVTSTTEYFTFITYPWADDVNPALIQMVTDAREEVFKVLGEAPEQKATIEIRPIYGLDPYNTMNVAAYYQKQSLHGENLIVIYSPHSFVYGFYNRIDGWEAEFSRTLVHEYTHMTHHMNFGNTGRMAIWMSEGLAEYVSGSNERLVYACQAAHSGILIPIVDHVNPVYKQDLAHMYSLSENTSLAYAYSYTLVAYIVETYGGLDRFWELAQAFDRIQNIDKAMQEVFEVPLEQFEQEWIEWVKTGC
jgi:hypothetical protein